MGTLERAQLGNSPEPMTIAGTVRNTGGRGSALEKAIHVLNEIATSPRPVGLAELASAIELPRTTIHRILQQLVDMGLVLRAPEKDHYLVGPNMIRLSALSLASMSTHPPLRSVLQELVNETEETCNVGVLDQDEIVYIERVEGTSPLRHHLHVGSRVPVHCTAIGKLLVAELHKNIRTRILAARPLHKFTENTLTDPDDLETEFARIRSQGYSINYEEYERGLTGLAVPIRDRGKKAVAALSINAPSLRMDLETARSYLPSMKAKAGFIAVMWGLAGNADGPPAN